MTPTPISVGSGSDLIASVPADLMAEVSGDSSTADVSAGGDETFETPGGMEAEGADAVGEELPVEDPQPEPVAAKPTDPAVEELPEGVVRGKNSQGKPGLFLEPARYETFHGAHKLVQATSELFGEPVTSEALAARQEAYLGQERLYHDVVSGDPASQGSAIDYLFDQMMAAKENGEVGVDPTVPFTQAFYARLNEKSPAAYAELRQSAANDLVGEMFNEAARTGDKALFVSAQNVARALLGFGKDTTDIQAVRAAAERVRTPFFTQAEMEGMARGADPNAQLRAENQRLRNQMTGRFETNQAAQLGNWAQATRQAVNSSILDSAVKPALASVEKAWEKFPVDYKDLVVDRLHSRVKAAITADAGFQARINTLDAAAKRAASAQARDRIGEQIKSLYINRAKLATESVKGDVLKFAANALAQRSSQNHERRQGAQTRTAPQGVSAPVSQSILPNDLMKMPNGTYDPQVAVKQAMRLINGR